jgi:PAS domain S-box-containing protein
MAPTDSARESRLPQAADPSSLLTLAHLAESGFRSLGEVDLSAWAREAAQELGVDGIMVAFLEPPDLARVRSQAFHFDGARVDQVCYLLEGTPCQEVVRHGPRVFPVGVQASFPDDPMLPELGIHAFAGAPLHSREGKVLGLLSVFSAAPMSDPDFVLAGVRILAARVGSEWDRLQRDRLLVAERRVLELISRDADLTRVLEAIVDEVEEVDPEAIASVLLVAPDGEHLRAGPAPRLPAGFRDSVNGLPIGPGQGSCGTAAHRKEPVIVTDIQTDPLWASARELAAAHGVRACWSHPVLGRDGAVLATFAVYYRTPRQPAPTELEVARRASDLVRLALEHDRRRRALEESEVRFRQLADHLDVVFWLSDPTNARLDYLSSAYARVWGRDPEELKANRQAWLESVHPDDRPGVVAAIRRLAEGTYDEEYRVVRPDGEVRWVADRAFPIRDGDGRLLRIAGLVRDITRQKEADLQLEESRRRLQTLMDHLPGAAYRCRNDPAWTLEMVSAGILELTGHSSEEFLIPGGVEYGNLVHPQDRERVWTAVQAAREAGTLLRHRLSHRHPRRAGAMGTGAGSVGGGGGGGHRGVRQRHHGPEEGPGCPAGERGAVPSAGPGHQRRHPGLGSGDRCPVVERGR